MLWTKAQMQALCSHLRIRHDTTDLRSIGDNKFTGNVDALGTLKNMKFLFVTYVFLRRLQLHAWHENNLPEQNLPFHVMVPRYSPRTPSANRM